MSFRTSTYTLPFRVLVWSTVHISFVKPACEHTQGQGTIHDLSPKPL